MGYRAGVRTTVEITGEQHRALSAVAGHRGLRGCSQLVREALDAYLHDLDSDEVDLLLGLEGSVDEREEQSCVGGSRRRERCGGPRSRRHTDLLIDFLRPGRVLDAPGCGMASVVVARYIARAGTEEQVAEHIAAMAAASRQEPGCLCYQPHRDPNDPQVFLLYEQYVDDAALQAHRDSAHFQRHVLGAVVELLSAREVAVYQTIE
jgi:quinol monooxygenase YgiN